MTHPVRTLLVTLTTSLLVVSASLGGLVGGLVALRVRPAIEGSRFVPRACAQRPGRPARLRLVLRQLAVRYPLVAPAERWRIANRIVERMGS